MCTPSQVRLGTAFGRCVVEPRRVMSQRSARHVGEKLTYTMPVYRNTVRCAPVRPSTLPSVGEDVNVNPSAEDVPRTHGTPRDALT
jgi:hypothetical protein